MTLSITKDGKTITYRGTFLSSDKGLLVIRDRMGDLLGYCDDTESNRGKLSTHQSVSLSTGGIIQKKREEEVLTLQARYPNGHRHASK